jgi:hypothetical protein
MIGYIDVGSAPYIEDCAQLGAADYYDRARRECRAYIGQLRRLLGPEPPGARLKTKANAHDFGTYLSVVCQYETDNQAAMQYAFRCESDGPEEWDAVARHELNDIRSSVI